MPSLGLDFKCRPDIFYVYLLIWEVGRKKKRAEVGAVCTGRDQRQPKHASSLVPPCGFQESTLDCQAWWLLPLPTGPSSQPGINV